MLSRLETLSPDLARRLRTATTAQRRAAVVAACEFALSHTKIQDTTVAEVMQSMQACISLEPQQKARIQSLAARLDDEYLDLYEAAEADRTKRAKSLCLFYEARAVMALTFAWNDDRESAQEAIYEAAMAVDRSQIELLRIVQSALQ
jgi:hypothetical protein